MSAPTDILSRLAETEYRPESIPGDRDADIALLISTIQTCEQFTEVTQGLKLSTAHILLGFAQRAASYAIRINDVTWTRHGLMAAQLTLGEEDTREVLVIYSLLYRALELLDADPMNIFEESARRAPHKFGAVTMEFAQRDAADKSIAAMGYVESEDRDGFKFVCTW